MEIFIEFKHMYSRLMLHEVRASGAMPVDYPNFFWMTHFTYVSIIVSDLFFDLFSPLEYAAHPPLLHIAIRYRLRFLKWARIPFFS